MSDNEEKKVTWEGPSEGEQSGVPDTLGDVPPGTVYDLEEPIPQEAFEEFDESLSPYSGLNPRLQYVCLLFAQGERGVDIAKKLGYSQSRLSVLLTRDDVKKKIRKYRNQFFERSIKERIKELSSDAIAEIERILNDPSAKDDTKLRAATWLLEKESGKATQTTQIESNTLLDLFEKIEKLQNSGQVIDLTPNEVRTIPAQSENSELGEPVDSENKETKPGFKNWDAILDEEFEGERNDKW